MSYFAGLVKDPLLHCIKPHTEIRQDWTDPDVINGLKIVIGRTPEDHANFPTFQWLLGQAMHHLYKTSGDLADLNASLQHYQIVLGYATSDSTTRVEQLEKIATVLGDRYIKFRDPTDLEEVLQYISQALLLVPEEATGDRARLLYRLGLQWALTPGKPLQDLSFRDRYQRRGYLNDMDSAAEIFQEQHKKGDAQIDQTEKLHCLALVLGERYQRLGDMKDLEEAIRLYQDILELTPEGHPNQSEQLYHLASCRHLYFKRLGNAADLDAAIQIFQTLLATTPDNHPERAKYLWELAASLGDRYQAFHKDDDLAAMETCYATSFENPTSAPESAWQAACHWASFAEKYCPEQCVAAHSAAFQVLPDIIWIGHNIPTRQNIIRGLNIERVTSNAVKSWIKHSQLSRAIEFMEQGLATTFQQIQQLRRKDLDVLRLDHAALLHKLCTEMYSGTTSDLRAIATQREVLLQEIRQQPELKSFLLPEPYVSLSYAAGKGPVIILNSHKDSCDALIILAPEIEPLHVNFANATLDALKLKQKMLKDLKLRCNVRTRGDSNSTRLFGNKEGFIFGPTEEGFKELLAWLWVNIVAPVYNVLKLKDHLQGVDPEIKAISSIFPNCTIIQGERATAEAVKEQLENSSWVHFACHGTQDPHEPTKSCLLLHGGTLELGTILQMPLSNPEFVYLAACQTAMGDSQLVNESFHLGGGFMATGFRSVIGTLWSMNDTDGPLVAEELYSHLCRDGQLPELRETAEALQRAVRKLRSTNVTHERVAFSSRIASTPPNHSIPTRTGAHAADGVLLVLKLRIICGVL
ncbi:CHAT domain-containing protein [Roridomyces roridus]|uniref:CHAT domain-containing protein n=1 Tax=Roridomyces roridus TaxID=1738132 RepID=A0AAD7FID4_9AGAR|nr:CHAT domain-containing protein [Roridomyces roridus]